MESPELIELKELLAKKKEVIARLDKLKSLKEKTKPHVFKKVYEDYSSRLTELNSKIEKKKETVRKLYSEYERAKAKYLKEKSVHEDELEEAKLRHMVGEYEDEVFRELEREKRIEIDALKEKIKEIDEKMKFLKEILEEKAFVKKEVVEVSKKKKVEEVPEPATQEKIMEEELEEIESILEESLTPVEEKEVKIKEDEKEVLVEEKFMDELGKEGEKKKTITCPKCGHENPPDSYFCEECGNELIPEDIEL